MFSDPRYNWIDAFRIQKFSCPESSDPCVFHNPVKVIINYSHMHIKKDIFRSLLILTSVPTMVGRCTLLQQRGNPPMTDTMGCVAYFFNGNANLLEANQHKRHNEKLQKERESKEMDKKKKHDRYPLHFLIFNLCPHS